MPSRRHVLLSGLALGAASGWSRSAAARAASDANAFGASLLAALPPNDSALVSSVGIRGAFALALIGARGETAAEMAAVLRLPAGAATDPDATADLQAAAARGPATLRFGHAVWAQRGLELRRAYVARISDGARLRQIDFRDPAAARRAINGWAAEATAGRIPDLVPAGAPTPRTRLALTNAVYFKAPWSRPFAPAATRPGEFRGLDGRRRAASMMALRTRARTLEADGLRALELDYAGGGQTFTVFLPADGPQLQALQADPARLERWTAALSEQSERPVHVTLPRLKLQARYELTSVLQALGLHKAFSDAADFGGMTPEPLHLGAAFHSTYLALDEHGSEAAAATSLLAEVTSGGGPPPLEFRVDRPFLFLIRDRDTGVNLFTGRATETALA